MRDRSELARLLVERAVAERQQLLPVCEGCGTQVEPGADGHSTHDHTEHHWCPTCCPHCTEESE